MKNVIFLFLSIILFSCSTENPQIVIETRMSEIDSILVMKVKNNTNRNFLIEFPMFTDFYYEDEYEKSNPEYIQLSQVGKLLPNEEDKKLMDSLGCQSFIKGNEFLKYIKANNEKEYYFKITNYRQGENIVLNNDGYFQILKNTDEKNKEVLLKIKDKKCGSYEYFTGDFWFFPAKVNLK